MARAPQVGQCRLRHDWYCQWLWPQVSQLSCCPPSAGVRQAVGGAVDVGHPQRTGLRDAQARGVEGLQQHAPRGVGAGVEQACYLLTCQQLRLFGRDFGKGDMELFAPVPQHGLKQELGRAGGLVHAAVGEFLLFDHVQQVGLHVLLGVLRRVAPVVFGHALDGPDVGLLRALCKAALHDGVEHSLA